MSQNVTSKKIPSEKLRFKETAEDKNNETAKKNNQY